MSSLTPYNNRRGMGAHELNVVAEVLPQRLRDDAEEYGHWDDNRCQRVADGDYEVG